MYAYQDFTLNLELDDSGQMLSVQAMCPVGEFYEQVKFTPPVPPHQDRWPWEEYESRQVETAGAQIFNMLFPASLRDALNRSIARLLDRDVLRLWINLAHPRLAAITWELAFSPEVGFLALDLRTPILRTSTVWSQPQAAALMSPSQKLRILVAYPAPVDLPALDLEKEKNLLRDALEIPVGRGQIDLAFLHPPVTIARLSEELRDGGYSILQISGHGGVDEKSRKVVMMFEDEQGQAEPVDPDQLRILLQGSGLRLVSAIALDSAYFRADKPLAGIVPAVMQAGIPAYIGLQGGILDTTAIRFVRTFYAQIADGLPLERAMTEARRAILFNARGTLEWAIPALYSLHADTTLFLPGRLEKTSRSGQSIVNVGGGVISGNGVIKVGGGGVNVSQDVQNIEMGRSLIGVDIESPEAISEVPRLSLDEIDPLISELKDAISSEPSLTPKDRIKSLGLAEQLRWELVSSNPDMERIVILEKQVAVIGSGPAQVMQGIRKKLSMG